MRKVCVVTGTRAEYGLLRKLLRKLQSDPTFELQLVVTGMHLSPEFGLTIKEILEDGFSPAACVYMLVSGDSPAAVTKSIGLGTIGFADAFQRLAPDLLLVLGDRFEILAAGQAAMVFNIPIAHLHGGESTEGLIDEAIRHALTKLSHLHFTAADAYRKRVVQMGEAPERVFNFGSLALDAIADMEFLSREEIESSLGIQLRDVNFLVTHHPLTLDIANQKREIDELIAALSQFPEAKLIFTMPNADTHGRSIMTRIRDYAAQEGGRVSVFASLGQLRYLSLLRLCQVVVGNSSSALIESPALGVPTVNIGDRQGGRLRASSVIDSSASRDDIRQAIAQALSPEFQAGLSHVEHPYGNGNAADSIVRVLRQTDFRELLRKRFHSCDQ